jgi:hypothetical protein
MKIPFSRAASNFAGRSTAPFPRSPMWKVDGFRMDASAHPTSEDGSMS